MKLLITVGSTRFDDLVNKVFSLIFLETCISNKITHLVIQFGHSPIQPPPEMKLIHQESGIEECLVYTFQSLNIRAFSFKKNFQLEIQEADWIISHAGRLESNCRKW